MFAEHGFDQTTVEGIAGRAGLTKRTFFRHYSDKREVLFGGGAEFQQRFVDALADVPAGATPLEAVARTLKTVGATFEHRRGFLQRRQAIIAANAELRERELVKLAAVAAALTTGLRERGVDEPGASVTAETAIAVFRTAFDRWVIHGEGRQLPEVIGESLDALQAVTAGGRPTAGRVARRARDAA